MLIAIARLVYLCMVLGGLYIMVAGIDNSHVWPRGHVPAGLFLVGTGLVLNLFLGVICEY